jgi:DNA (cytosine-5)-methyltransferase 1
VSARRPRLLDLFCCAGGAGAGYARAGFDVVGVDVDRLALRRYPGQAVRADALEVIAHWNLAAFDAIHASPPCQTYSQTRHTHKASHPDLLGAVWQALEHVGIPYVVENVPGAPMPGALTLCGSEFGLRAVDAGRVVTLRRHRLFVSNVHLWGAGGCSCAADRAAGRIAGAYGGGSTDLEHARTVRHGGYTPPTPVRAALLGIDWMTQAQLSQAIPPAYTTFIGGQLLEHLAAA